MLVLLSTLIEKNYKFVESLREENALDEKGSEMQTFLTVGVFNHLFRHNKKCKEANR